MAVALGTMAILAGSVMPLALSSVKSMEITSTRKEILSIETGLKSFYSNFGRFPTTAEGIKLLFENGKEVYISGSLESIQKDAWGEDYIYTDEAARFHSKIVSKGPNRKKNTGSPDDDDLIHNVSASDIADSWKQYVFGQMKAINLATADENGGKIGLFDELTDPKYCGQSWTFISTSNAYNMRTLMTKEEWEDIKASEPNCCPNHTCAVVYANVVKRAFSEDPWKNFLIWEPSKSYFYSAGPDGNYVTEEDNIYPEFGK
ncbi:type II secretion system protein GspG [Deltaproteobacteria bacterium TL4]